MARPKQALAFHTLQLAGVWTVDSRSKRRARTDKDPEGPSLEPQVPRLVGMSEDGTTFRVSFAVSVTVPLDADETFEAFLRMVAFVGSESEIERSVARAFTREQMLYLLWPFARAYIDQLSIISGLGVPPLPLLVRPPLA